MNPQTRKKKPPRERQYGDTTVINVSERYNLDLPDETFPERFRNELVWITRHKD